MGLALLLLPASVHAQYIGGRAPEPPPPPASGTIESPEAALARNIRLLAINPRDYVGLLGAGRAALRLGDAQAAIGFFGRAEELNPAHWAPKAGQGTALAQMGDGTAALGMFGEAQRLGATQTLVALDRGLAFDLLGRQAEAQSDYRVLLSGADSAEARRRLALSLAISGRKAEALAALDPLLAHRDNGAKRTRAFILALTGDVEGARVVIGLIMPGASSGFDPFLRRLATLGPGQKAAAVHLGMMPAEGAAMAEADLPIPNPRVAPPPVRTAERPKPVANLANAGGSAATVPRESRLAEIEQTLSSIPASASAESVPPAPRPIVERAPTRTRLAASKVSDLRSRTQEVKPARLAARETGSVTGKGKTKGEASESKSAAKAGSKVADKPADKPSKRGSEAAEDKPVKPGASRVYVQLAGGANTDRMTREYEKIRARKASLFRGRQPLVSEVRGWARLLVGPFKDGDAAQEFVNDLHGAKLEGFVWTAPGGTKFEKLSSK